MNKIKKCDGCNKHCEFGAKLITNSYILDMQKQYYTPTINGDIITAYVEDGKQKSIDLCETSAAAIEVAQQVSRFCSYHMQNAK